MGNTCSYETMVKTFDIDDCSLFLRIRFPFIYICIFIPQASALFHKIREFNPSLNVDDLHELGSIVTGMSEEDIRNMRDDKMNVVNLAAQLADYEDDLSLSQVG